MGSHFAHWDAPTPGNARNVYLRVEVRTHLSGTWRRSDIGTVGTRKQLLVRTVRRTCFGGRGRRRGQLRGGLQRRSAVTYPHTESTTNGRATVTARPPPWHASDVLAPRRISSRNFDRARPTQHWRMAYAPFLQVASQEPGLSRIAPPAIPG